MKNIHDTMKIKMLHIKQKVVIYLVNCVYFTHFIVVLNLAFWQD